MYCCLWGAKAGLYHRFLVPTWLVVLAGIWVGPIYYFALALDSSLRVQRLVSADEYDASYAGQTTWRSVGLGCSSLNW